MLRHRLRLRRWLRRTPAPRPTPDPLASERRVLDEWQRYLDALAAAAMTGDMAAAVRLADLAEDRVGHAKRRMAEAALEEVLAARVAHKD